MIYGYAGSILRINLSDEKVSKENLCEDLVRNYIGGTGICSRILFDEISPGIDPLGEYNKIIFGTGPLTGTFWTSAGRFMVASKSPLTGIWAESHVGGFFGAEMKFAGWDFIIVEGKSEKHVEIIIHDDDIEITKSENWGHGTAHTIRKLSEKHNDSQVMCIGQAGENLVKYACVINNYSNAAGRTGLGAVMGSKKLKAIAVKGTGSFEVSDYDAFYEFTKISHERVMNNPQNKELGKYGTNLLVSYKSAIGELVSKNHQRGVFKNGAEKLSADVLREKYFVKSRACFVCRTHCKKVYEVKEGAFAGTISGGPEYEGTMAFGTNCLNSDFGSILKANEMCNDYGMDVISCGCTIAFAMECLERGIIKEEEIGYAMSWGDGEGIVKMVEDIAFRRGFGDILAEGTRKASIKIGKNAQRYAMEVKGLEISGQDGRGHRSVALTHAISVRGADHLRSLVTVDQLGYIEEAKKRFGENALPEVCNPYSEDKKAMAVKITEDVFAIRDSLITCWYTCGWPPIFWIEDFAQVLPLVTGIEHFGDVKNLMLIAERICNLRRLFNIREGLTEKDDYLPERFLKEPMPDGPSIGQTVNLKKMLNEYYEIRGWDENGIPRDEKAKSLGLEKELKEVISYL